MSEKESAKKAADAKTPVDIFPVVAIGASAGGLEALEQLFDHMPDDTGLAYLVVTHQHPGHTSLLPDLLGKHTAMTVVEATDGMRMERNCVYVAPPGAHVAFMNGKLQLMEPVVRGVLPLLIDHCFRSLAEDLGDRAICIVLSGTGSDGTIGLKAVKGAGGMAMVQEVRTARYGGMPASAIATSLADFVLPPAEMPEQLIAYVQTMAHYDQVAGEAEPQRLEQPMQKIFLLLRTRTGHDFSAYKPSTMRRRIERRMTVHQFKSPEDYVHMLRDNPHEIDILFKELLIGVTSFFRDPAAFRLLAESILPSLMAARPDHYTFRVWIPGCCSGEEAFTLAILLRECAKKAGKMFDFQIFATDLDNKSIETARGGEYPEGIAADVPPEILQGYFLHDDGIYRVRKEIREMLVFAQQNVIKDPPFTKLDLLCCRNLLIYLNGDLQRRLLPIFHYTLKPGGLLMLGPSESIGGFGDLFETVDNKWKLFKRKETATRALPEIPAQAVPPKAGDRHGAGFTPEPRHRQAPVQFERLILNRFAPPTVVVNDRGDILFIHGRTGMYLEPPAGQPSSNIHEMAREGLRVELAAGLRHVLSGAQEVVRPRIRVKTNGDYAYVDLSISRIAEPETLRGLLLITFRPSGKPQAESAAHKGRRKTSGKVEANRNVELERELQYTKESLQTTVEELETSNEELKSANEELQSTNEELQSTNEELETSKEEMQSLNEELTTVNAELQSKVTELSRANDDMQNLLNSTDIATIFLDNELNIKRYTEKAKKIVNLIPSDIGRPIGDLVSNLNYDKLAQDAREVLGTLARKELEVQCRNGVYHLVCMMPYRTADNVIEGVVITFVDISATKVAEAKAGAEQRRQLLLQNIFDTFSVPALVMDTELRVYRANTAFCTTFATNRGKTEGQLIYDVGGGEWDLPKLHELLEDTIQREGVIDNFEVSGTFPKIGARTFRLNARLLEHETGLSGMILMTFDKVAANP